MDKLKPCPFCGKRVEISQSYLSFRYFIQCEDCCSTVAYDTKEEISKFWNTRPAEEALKAEVEMLKAEETRFKRALHNLKDDCTRRKRFAVSDEEKLFLYETISHIEAELDFNTDTKESEVKDEL